MGTDLTYAVLDGIALRQASLSDDALDPVLRRELINAEVDRIWEEFKGDPFYRFSTPLVIGPDVEFLSGKTAPNNGEIVTLNPTTRSVIRQTGTFVAGSLLVYTKWRSAGDLILSQLVLRLLSSGQAVYYELIAGTEEAYVAGSDQCSVTLIRSLSVATADFSPRYFDRILSIKDDVARTTQRAFDQVFDANEFAELTLSPTKGRRVAYYHRAGAIDFFIPTSGLALGTVAVEYAGRPGRYTKETEDESILIPRERTAALIGAVTAAFQKMTTASKGAPSAS